MVSLHTVLAAATCLLPFAIAGPPTRKVCCDPGQGEIVSPGQGSHINPGETFEFNYTPRNSFFGIYSIKRYWYSNNIKIQLLTADSGKYLTGDEIKSQLLAGKADYTFGTFSSKDAARMTADDLPVPDHLTMPDLSKSILKNVSASDLQVYLGVVEEWVQDGEVVETKVSATYHWLTYNMTNPAPYSCHNPGYRALQSSCECRSCVTYGVDLADTSSKLFSEVRMTEAECRNLCDNTKNCYTFTWNYQGSVIGGNPDDSCTLYSASYPALKSSNALLIEMVDQACKDGCYQATYTGE